jgi:hypothetical protein
MEESPETKKQPQVYHLYSDPLLLAAAENDTHLSHLLDGLRLADVRLLENLDNPAMVKVRREAEDNVRKVIKEAGYTTSEPAKGGSPEPRP